MLCSNPYHKNCECSRCLLGMNSFKLAFKFWRSSRLLWMVPTGGVWYSACVAICSSSWGEAFLIPTMMQAVPMLSVSEISADNMQPFHDNILALTFKWHDDYRLNSAKLGLFSFSVKLFTLKVFCSLIDLFQFQVTFPYTLHLLWGQGEFFLYKWVCTLIIHSCASESQMN